VREMPVLRHLSGEETAGECGPDGRSHVVFLVQGAGGHSVVRERSV
jgi:hypothetical protein